MKSEFLFLLSFFLVLGIFFSFPLIENNYSVDENGFKHYVLTSEKNDSTLDVIAKSLSRYNRELTDEFNQMNSFLSLFLLFLLLFLFYERRWFFALQTSNEIRFNTNILKLFSRNVDSKNQIINNEIVFLRIFSSSKLNSFSSNLLPFQAQISHLINNILHFKKNIFIFSVLVFLLIFPLTGFAFADVTFTTNDDADSAMLSTQTGEIAFTTGTDNTNAILVVGIGADDSSITGVDSITWGTGAGCTGTPQSFTQDGSPLENTDAHTEIWYLVAPTQSASARNVCVDWGSGDVPGDWAFNVAMFENVDQTTPFSTTNTATGTVDPMTGTVTVAVGEMGYQVSVVINQATATVDTGDTELLQVSTGGQTKQTIFISFDSTVAAPSTLGSTISKDANWSMKLVALAEASSAKPPISVTDTPTVTDSAIVIESHSISGSDTPVITDSVTTVKTSSISVTDTPTVTDSAIVIESHSISGSDTPVISDSVTESSSLTNTDTPAVTDSAIVIESHSISGSDTPTVTDSATAVKTSSISVTDTPTITDSGTESSSLTNTDTPTVTDSATVVESHSISGSDTPVISDSVTESSSITNTDTPTVTDSATAVKTSSISVSDTPVLSDSVIVVRALSVTDTPVITDSGSVVESHSISLSDTPVLSDSATTTKTSSISVTDTPVLSDSATTVKSSSISVTDTPTISDSSDIVEISAISVSDTPTISDSVTILESHIISVSDTPTISDSTIVSKAGNLNETDTPTISDSVTILESHIISVSDTPIIYDSGMVASMFVIIVTDTPIIYDSGVIVGMFVIIVTDTPIIYDSSNLGGIVQIADETSVSVTTSADVTTIFEYPETEESTSITVTLDVALPTGISGTIVIQTVVENNIESGLNLATAVDITAPCTDTCTIKFTILNTLLTAAGLTPESASIFHDSNGNEILELSEAIATTRDTTSIPGSTIFTATTDSTSKFGVGAGGGSEDEEDGGGGGCADCTPPTLGLDSSGQRRVSNGFSYNGNSVDVELYFTPYPLITTLIGVNNTAVFKIYENSGPQNIRHFELAFGLDEIQGISQNPSKIEWDKTWDNIETITVIDPENVFENIVIETEVGDCLQNSNESACLIITIFHSFRAPLEHNIVGTNVWDHKRNAWQNYYNEGVVIEGDSLNPPKQHIGIHKGQVFSIIETSKTTAIDESGNNWSLEKGLWSKEYIPSIAPDPKAIELFKLKEKEIAKAAELLLQMCPKCYDISFDKINNTFAYKFPYQYENKLDDPEVQRKLQIEADRAYELHFKNYQWFEERD